MAEKTKRPMGEIIEDYALKPVPDYLRSNWLMYFAITGIFMSLYYVAVGPVVFAMAGWPAGWVVLALAFVINTIVISSFVYIGWKYGLAFDMSIRLLGWGHRGSFFPSLSALMIYLIFFFMQAYWLAMVFNHVWPAIPLGGYYVILAVLVYVLALWGARFIGYFNYVAVPLGIIASIYVLISFYVLGDFTISGVIAQIREPMLPGGFGGGFDFAVMAVGGGALSGVWGRFMKNRAGALGSGLFGSVLGYVLFPVMGIFMVFPVIAILAPIIGGEAAGMALFGPGLPFAVALGGLGAFIVLLYQLNLEMVTALQPSISLSNFFAAVFKWLPGRWVSMLFVVVIGTALLFVGAMETVMIWMSYAALGIGVVCFICLADFVYRLNFHHSTDWVREKIRNWNPIAFIVVVVTYGVSVALWKTGVIMSPSFVGFPLAFVLYYVLSLATKGRYQKDVVTLEVALPE